MDLASELAAATELPLQEGRWPHVRLPAAATAQRLTLARDDDGGVLLRIWPAELKEQALAFYGEPARTEGVLALCASSSWRAEPRGHLAYWLAAPGERWYFDGGRLALPAYLEAWREDLGRIGGHPRHSVREGLWPWLCERGYAGGAYDNALMEDFLSHAPPDVHLRPAVRLTHRWEQDEAAELTAAGGFRASVRREADRVLLALGESPL